MKEKNISNLSNGISKMNVDESPRKIEVHNEDDDDELPPLEDMMEINEDNKFEKKNFDHNDFMEIENSPLISKLGIASTEEAQEISNENENMLSGKSTNRFLFFGGGTPLFS